MIQNNNCKSANISKIMCSLTFILYLLYLFYLVFFSHTYGRMMQHHSINYIPFKTIETYIRSNNKHNQLVNIAGNIFAFLPLGFLLPLMLANAKSMWKIVVITMLLSTLIEVIQYITGVGVSDIDDVILNTIGGVLGFLLYRVFNLVLNK